MSNHPNHRIPWVWIIFILLLVFSFAFFSRANAADTGFKNPTVTVNDTSVGTTAWSNPNNSQSSDNTYAINTLPLLQSNYLKATAFNFSVPSGKQIDGVEVSIERSYSLCTPDCQPKDYGVYLVNNGTVTGTNLASAAIWPSTDVYRTYGGSNNLWGNTLTDTIVNASNFGVVISAFDSVASRGRIDHIRMKIYYSDPPPVIVNASQFKPFWLLPFLGTAYASTTCTFTYVGSPSTTQAICDEWPARTSTSTPVINYSQNVWNGFILFFIVLYGMATLIIKLSERR